MSYEIKNGSTYRVDDDGSMELMANFTATITEEVRYVDGINTQSFLTISGQQKSKTQPKNSNETNMEDLPTATIAQDDFLSMNWPLRVWGVRAIIFPITGAKDDLRTAIQLASTPTIRTVYKHLGWTDINGDPAYIHAGGAIGPNGNDANVSVQLPKELSKYNLDNGTADSTEQAVQATLNLATVPETDIGWILLAATVAPLHGPCDFAIHLAGRTGTFKSELLSLFQSHYGAEMDARNLPGSWSSTANAIEAQTFLAANAPYVLDDFVPGGTSTQQKAYQQNADKIIRGAGNQAGRSRLTDRSNLQQTMYPRGIILSTGEDIPEGHSVRARMMILELTPGDVSAAKLSAAQANRSLYPDTIAAYVQSLANEPYNPATDAAANRDALQGIGHTRTPSMAGRLQASANHFLDWAGKNGAKNVKAAKAATMAAIKAHAEQQPSYLETADPTEQFINAIKQAFATNTAHARQLNGGIPRAATQLGWTQVGGGQDGIPDYRSHGPCIGWASWTSGEFYLELNAGFAAIKKQGGSDIALSKQTMLKRLKDAGLLKRTDDARQRNTVRITAENHQRQVVALPLAAILETAAREPGDDDPNAEADNFAE